MYHLDRLHGLCNPDSDLVACKQAPCEGGKNLASEA